MKIKKFASFILAIIMLFSLATCNNKTAGNNDDDDDDNTPAQTLVITPTTVSPIKINQTVQLGVTLTPANASETYTWTSEDNTVASVSSSGLVTGVGQGSTFINAKTSGGLSATRAISVTSSKAITSLSITGAPAESIKETHSNINLGYTIVPTDADKEIHWTSSTSGVAVIGDLTGELDVKGPGTSTITATDKVTGISDSFVLSVDPHKLEGIAIINMPEEINGKRVMSNGASHQLGVTIDETAVDYNGVTWSTEDNNPDAGDALVAAVSEGGLITTANAGSIKIIASANGTSYKDSFILYVAAIEFESVRIDGPALGEMYTGDEYQLELVFTPSNPDNVDYDNITWESSNDTALEVNETTGYLTAIAAAAEAVRITATIPILKGDGDLDRNETIYIDINVKDLINLNYYDVLGTSGNNGVNSFNKTAGGNDSGGTKETHEYFDGKKMMLTAKNSAGDPIDGEWSIADGGESVAEFDDSTVGEISFLAVGQTEAVFTPANNNYATESESCKVTVLDFDQYYSTANRAIGNASVPESYIFLRTPEQLQSLTNTTDTVANYMHFILGNDIDMTDFDFSPIVRKTDSAWYGELNGMGYAIRNLTIDKDASTIGLFGKLNGSSTITSNGRVRNLALIGGKIKGKSYVAPFAGEIVSGHANSGLRNCFTDTSVEATLASGSSYACGLIGYNRGSAKYCVTLSEITKVSGTGNNYLLGYLSGSGYSKYVYALQDENINSGLSMYQSAASAALFDADTVKAFTKTELKNADIYENFDPVYWVIKDGFYPRLRKPSELTNVALINYATFAAWDSTAG